MATQKWNKNVLTCRKKNGEYFLHIFLCFVKSSHYKVLGEMSNAQFLVCRWPPMTSVLLIFFCSVLYFVHFFIFSFTLRIHNEFIIIFVWISHRMVIIYIVANEINTYVNFLFIILVAIINKIKGFRRC